MVALVSWASGSSVSSESSNLSWTLANVGFSYNRNVTKAKVSHWASSLNIDMPVLLLFGFFIFLQFFLLFLRPRKSHTCEGWRAAGATVVSSLPGETIWHNQGATHGIHRVLSVFLLENCAILLCLLCGHGRQLLTMTAQSTARAGKSNEI